MNRLLTSTLMLFALSAGAATLAGAQTNDPAQNAPQQGQYQGPQQGQYQGHHAPDPDRQTRMLTHRLGLTPDQSAQVEPILVARDQQMQALRANPPADPKTMHHQMHAIQRDTDLKLNGVFNDQQKQAFAQMKANHHHHMHQGQPDGQQQPQQPSV